MRRVILFLLISTAFITGIYASSTIPTQAWSRDVGASGYTDGAPIGGFGAGTITWKNNGDFYLSRLDIGTGDEAGSFTAANTNCKFFMYQKPASGAATVQRLDSANLGTGQAVYNSLFPFAWVNYSGSRFSVKAKVTQYSPIIPEDYQRVSYPVGVYEWELTNPTTQNYDAAIMLTWENPYGSSASLVTDGNYTGLVLNKAGTGTPTLETQGEFCLASLSSANVTVTRMSAANRAALETDFSTDGALSNTVGSNTIGAVAFKVTLAPGQTVRIPIILSWDIPITQSQYNAKWYRKYTQHFNRLGTNSWAIAREALADRAVWEQKLDEWVHRITDNPNYPEWLKSMLLNEMYIYFTAGTYWEAGGASGQADNPAENMFSHLESYIYDFYGTSDVRFYGSWALFMNWPEIDKQCIKQFADSVYNNRSDRPAGLGTTAHDIGSRADVFTRWNAYVYRDSTNWKDLNSKLVLMVYRDWHLTGRTDSDFLDYCWQSCKIAMEKTATQDADGDGLPDSNGIDQTYDDMDLTGDTSYCGGLYLASLLAAKELALAKGETALAQTYQERFDFAQPNFESQLWTGQYYKIDTGSHDPTRIMSDQLCGQWYNKALGLPGIVSDANAVSSFQKIYDNNFAKFGNGSHGVVNVMNANGTIDSTSSQTEECWVGTSWGVAAGMVHHGMEAQADDIGQSLLNTIWNTGQYWFRTPEAFRINLTMPRAMYYMRATAVWAVKHAYDSVHPAPTYTPSPTATNTNTWDPAFPTYTFTATATATATRTFTHTPTITPTFADIRVNCGGPEHNDGTHIWAADYGYTAGTAAGPSGTVAGAPAGQGTLYQTERWGMSAYTFNNIPFGTYDITLKFAETYSGAYSVGARVFDVFIEGTRVLDNLDIYAEAGASTALDKVFNAVQVSDGVLNISFSASVDNANITAIEVVLVSQLPTSTHTSTPTRTPTATFTYTATDTDTPDPSWTKTFTNTHTNTSTNTATHTYTNTFTITNTPTATFTASTTPTRMGDIFIDCASNDNYTDGSGNLWLADRAYGGGNAWGYVTAGSTNDWYTGEITLTNDDELYQSERWSGSGNTLLQYNADTGNGMFEVELHFTEGFCTAAGCRQFNVALESLTVETNLDIFAETGAQHAALVKTYYVEVTDGTLNINLTQGSADWPLINAIKISTYYPPTKTPTNTVPATATYTFSATSTFTNTSTHTQTIAATNTYTDTVTDTATHTYTNTNTLTETATNTPENTYTNTYTATHTHTYTVTDTTTDTHTATITYTPSDTVTGTPPATHTFTDTPTETYTHTFTQTYTDTPADTFTHTPENTNTNTPQDTFTHTYTATYTNTSTNTNTSTQTYTPSVTNTFTDTVTPGGPTLTFTDTPTETGTPTHTFTSSYTNTATNTHTSTATYTNTLTHTYTNTATFTSTHSQTPSYTASLTETPVFTQTYTFTYTSTNTPVFTATPTYTRVPADKQQITEVLPYPNPFNPALYNYIRISFKIAQPDTKRLALRIYSSSYRLIREVAYEQAALTQIVNRGYIQYESKHLESLSNGTYYFVLIAGGQGDETRSKVEKMIIIK
ncbi:MAG TPA: GH116 family glycosyl hydrolase [Candidatus Goldiibacteriota bacterium]|nr:GH116 family glycosyl hydrolase [Candidatus Goldiibacteriota bacterium]